MKRVDELTPDMKGVWITHTQGSSHEWDLDKMTFCRLPGEGRSRFAYDGEPSRIIDVKRWPKVGKVFFVWFDPGLMHDDQWRQSSTIRYIEEKASD